MTGKRGARTDRIVFWQPIESPHQRDFLEALAVTFAGDVVLAAERRLPAERAAQGWPRAVHQHVRVVDATLPHVFRELVAYDTPETLHVFSGFFSHPVVWNAFRRLAPTRARRAMLSEAPETACPTGWFKRLRGRYLVGRFGERIEFVLAMGALGRRFMEDVGFPRERVDTFGYRLAVPPEPWPSAPLSPSGPVRFISAGQFIHRKGFDVLVDALAMIQVEGWSCEIYGDGPMRGSLARRIAGRALADRIFLRKTVANVALRQEIAASDWTVMPSRHDGWGMLVNESLIAGTPVVCTDGCGSADLVVDAVAGHVVPAGDAASLAAVLQRCVAGGKITDSRRRFVHRIASRQGVDDLVLALLRRVDAGG